MLLSNTVCLWAAGVSGLAAKGVIFTPLLQTQPSQIKDYKEGKCSISRSRRCHSNNTQFLTSEYPTALPSCLPRAWKVEVPCPSITRTQPRPAQRVVLEGMRRFHSHLPLGLRSEGAKLCYQQLLQGVHAGRI